MDRRYVVGCVRRFADRVKAVLDVQEVLLYGSYANGSPTRDSDIDVAVIVGTAPADWLDASAMLFRLSRDIDLAMEPVLLDPEHDRSGFVQHVRSTGKVIYSRNL